MGIVISCLKDIWGKEELSLYFACMLFTAAADVQKSVSLPSVLEGLAANTSSQCSSALLLSEDSKVHPSKSAQHCSITLPSSCITLPNQLPPVLTVKPNKPFTAQGTHSLSSSKRTTTVIHSPSSVLGSPSSAAGNLSSAERSPGTPAVGIVSPAGNILVTEPTASPDGLTHGLAPGGNGSHSFSIAKYAGSISGPTGDNNLDIASLPLERGISQQDNKISTQKEGGTAPASITVTTSLPTATTAACHVPNLHSLNGGGPVGIAPSFHPATTARKHKCKCLFSYFHPVDI